MHQYANEHDNFEVIPQDFSDQFQDLCQPRVISFLNPLHDDLPRSML